MLINMEHTPITKSEILELLDLKGWSRERLAVEMCVSLSAIHKWVRDGECQTSPASVLLWIWLRDAREKLKNVNGRANGTAVQSKRKVSA